jgi:arylsulfatase A-like enzyme
VDILSISLSANDVVGHNFGPDSVEAKEMAHHVDRQVARLLGALDRSVGESSYLLVLTSDHGVGYSPEAVTVERFEARRYDNEKMLRLIRRRLNFTIRYLDWSPGFAGAGFYFDPEALIYGGRAPAELEDIAAGIIRATPGIAAAYTRTQILAGDLPDTEIARRVRAAYHPGRSPDVYVLGEPYWLEGTSVASHGTPYNYDTHVPVVFFGAGLEPARIGTAVDVMDIAPTITAILGCTPPSASEGQPLPAVVDGIATKPRREF